MSTSLPAHGGDRQALARACGRSPQDILDFSVNVRPDGPPEYLRLALVRSLEAAALYPSPHGEEARAACARRYHLPEEAIVFGNGTSELFWALARVLKKAGCPCAAIPEPAFGEYEQACLQAGLASLHPACTLTWSAQGPERDRGQHPAPGLRPALDWQLPLDDILALPEGAALFLANPGNPAGTWLSPARLTELVHLRPDLVFVLDEAFLTYVARDGLVSFLPVLARHLAAPERSPLPPEARLVVVRSLTKFHALAGIRTGFAAATKALALALQEELPPWSCNAMALACACAVLEPTAENLADERRTRQENRRNRKYLCELLAPLPLAVCRSAANYLLLRLDAPRPTLAQELLEGFGIAVRDCATYRTLRDGRWLRVAVRGADENLRLVRALQTLLGPQQDAAACGNTAAQGPQQAENGPWRGEKNADGDRTTNGTAATCQGDRTTNGTAATCQGDRTTNGTATTCRGDRTTNGTAATCRGDRTTNGTAATCPGGRTTNGTATTCRGDRTTNGTATPCRGDRTTNGTATPCRGDRTTNGTAATCRGERTTNGTAATCQETRTANGTATTCRGDRTTNGTAATCQGDRTERRTGPVRGSFGLRRTPALMLQGTSSGAGKSVLTAALCRIFRQDGYDVAPFKAQNMSLNSGVTRDGLEMGRAQILQAAAAGLEADVRMNPVLLKPLTDRGSQVVLLGRPHGTIGARDFLQAREALRAPICQAYHELAREHEVMILEGAGSPAEVNLRKADLVNMNMAREARARVLLVGDIDRGGVYASFLGTWLTFDDVERRLLAGFVVNRFRGDPGLLAPAHDYLARACGKRVLGVVPFLDLDLPEEDSLSLATSLGHRASLADPLDIAMVVLGRTSNFTDLEPLAAEPDVTLRLVHGPEDWGEPDIVVLPGSRSVVRDARRLDDTGLAQKILAHGAGGGWLVGICGGMQLLGDEILDPDGVESDTAAFPGLGLLPLRTTMARGKTLRRIACCRTPFGPPATGYEIHHGQSVLTRACSALFREDGREDFLGLLHGHCLGTYLHGLFDDDTFRRAFLDHVRTSLGKAPQGRLLARRDLDRSLDALACAVREHLDMQAIYRLLGL